MIIRGTTELIAHIGFPTHGFKSPPIESEMAVLVVDCGGTARCGVYPRKRMPTVNLTPVP